MAVAILILTFEVYGEDGVRYTRNDGYVYATLLDWKGEPVTLSALQTGGATLGKVSKVELLGSNINFKFVQDNEGLTVTPEGTVQSQPDISDQSLAKGYRVLRITHDKGWINDDDPGVEAQGEWLRKCNLGTGDFNNDLTFSNTTGDIWSCSFTGSSVALMAPKEQGAGRIEVQIDGQKHETIDLSESGSRLAQQIVSTITNLTPGDHTISVINLGGGPVSLDAIMVQ